MSGSLKSLILRATPQALLHQLKKFHYRRALKSFSEPDLEVVARLVRPGDHVIDIGAHVGWYTKVLSECVRENGRVYSVEPVPSTFELLSFCVRKLRLANVTLMRCAISDHDGSALMEIPWFDFGGENFYQARIVDRSSTTNGRGRFLVPVRAVDSLFSEVHRKVTFIKCDVEGHELPVMTGANRLIATAQPALLVEITGDPDIVESDSWTLLNTLGREGYSAYWFDGQGLRRRSQGDKAINYFFLTPRHLALLDASKG